MTRWLLVFALGALLALPCAPLAPALAEDAPGSGAQAGGDDALAGPHALDDGITAARQALRDGDADKARETFLALLEAHKGEDYAKARREEIEELILHLACGAKHERPRVKDLLSGKVLSWDADSGRIRIVYTPETSKDLDRHEGLIHIPPRVSGPFTLELHGNAYPTDAAKRPVIAFGGDQHPETGRTQTWRVTFGAPEPKGRSFKVTTRFDFDDGGKVAELVSKSGSLRKPEKPYKLVLKGQKTKLTAYVGSRTAAYVKKDEDRWGWLSFDAPGWTEMKLTATIEPGWIENRLDEVFRETLGEFCKTYDAGKHVPGWLSEPLSREESKPDRKPTDLVADLSSKHYDLFLEVDNAIRMEEWELAEAGIPKLRSQGLSEAICQWLYAKLYHTQNRLEDALAPLAKLTELEPNFLEAVLMRGSLLRELGRFDEALTTFQKATGVYAQVPSAYAQAAQAMLYAGRPEDAAKLTRAAARNGVWSPTLLSLRDALQKVVHGPVWTKRYEHRSQNYHVISNIDRVLCREASKILEEAFEAYRKKIGFVPRDRTRLFKVYLFKSQEGFLAYMGRLSEFMGKPNDQAAGVYTPLLKQLLIWNLPRRADMYETIRHEGFHQYLDRLMPNPPVWFNEGMAVYHENARNEGGQLTFGHIHPGYVRLLQSRGLKPIKKFLTAGPGLFYEDGHRSYGQGWLLVHMLQHTTPAYRQRFETLMEGLKEGSAFATVKKVFPDSMLPQLEKDLEAYLEKLASG